MMTFLEEVINKEEEEADVVVENGLLARKPIFKIMEKTMIRSLTIMEEVVVKIKVVDVEEAETTDLMSNVIFVRSFDIILMIVGTIQIIPTMEVRK